MCGVLANKSIQTSMEVSSSCSKMSDGWVYADSVIVCFAVFRHEKQLDYIVQMLSPGKRTGSSDRAWQKQHVYVARGNLAPFHGTLSCSPLNVDTNGSSNN